MTKEYIEKCYLSRLYRRKGIIAFMFILFLLPIFKEIFEVGFFEFILSDVDYGLISLFFFKKELTINICLICRYCVIVFLVIDLFHLIVPSSLFIPVPKSELERKNMDVENKSSSQILYLVFNCIYLPIKLFGTIFGFVWLPFLSLIDYIKNFFSSHPAESGQIIEGLFNEKTIYLIIIIICFICKFVNDIVVMVCNYKLEYSFLQDNNVKK